MNMQLPRTARQGGFTLIELIVVIVILGILAATALPKFADLGADARYAAVRAAKGSIDAAVSLARGKALVNATAATGTVSLDGVSVSLVNGFPDAESIAAAAGLSSTDWHITSTGSTVTVVPISFASDAAKQATCRVVYNESAAANTAPVVTLTASVSGC